jgi:nucleotide-binding universal stress UspA family protein
MSSTSARWAMGEGTAALTNQMLAFDDQQRARAQAFVQQAAARTGQVAPRWVDGGPSPYWSLLQHAPYADLIVLGQTDDEDPDTGALPPELVPGLLCDTGRPALLVPYAGTFDAKAKRVLVAWKPTREAARALTASLPWLRAADGIHLALRPESDESEFDHLGALQQWLRAQGLHVPVQVHRLGSGDVGESVLSLAADVGADLLVMGCFGHSRAREWVMGGATRSILRAMTLPVLMAH